MYIGFNFLTGYVFAFRQYESYIASKLFQPASQDKNDKEKKPLNYKSIVSVKSMWLVYAPKCMRKLCCKPNQNDLNFLKARKQLWKELNVVNFLREFRFLRAIAAKIKKNPKILKSGKKSKDDR